MCILEVKTHLDVNPAAEKVPTPITPNCHNHLSVPVSNKMCVGVSKAQVNA